MAQEANNTGLNPRLGKGRLDSLRDRRQTVAPVEPRKLPEASARPRRRCGPVPVPFGSGAHVRRPSVRRPRV